MKWVVHCKKQKYDVYIGRKNPSVDCKDCKWGNPFAITDQQNREQVIEKYEKWLRSKPEMIEMARTELKGKVLGWYCVQQM